MPRTSTKEYLRSRKRLKRYWGRAPVVYGYLSAAEQGQLHDYFRPNVRLSANELLAHRTDVSVRRPSLPSQAGKALRTIDAAAAAWAIRAARKVQAPIVTTKRRPGDPQHLVVYSVVNPEVDVEALARLVLEVADSKYDATGDQAGVEDHLADKHHQASDQSAAA